MVSRIRAVFGRLGGHPGDEAGAGVPLQLAGVVVQMRGEGDLAAVLALLQQQGFQTAPARIYGGGQPCGACP